MPQNTAKATSPSRSTVGKNPDGRKGHQPISGRAKEPPLPSIKLTAVSRTSI
jgi:hypothetical protein